MNDLIDQVLLCGKLKIFMFQRLSCCVSKLRRIFILLQTVHELFVKSKTNSFSLDIFFLFSPRVITYRPLNESCDTKTFTAQWFYYCHLDKVKLPRKISLVKVHVYKLVIWT